MTGGKRTREQITKGGDQPFGEKDRELSDTRESDRASDLKAFSSIDFE